MTSHVITLVFVVISLYFVPAASYAVGLVITGADLPIGQTIDQYGNLYIAQYGDNAICKYSASGILLTKYPTASGPSGVAVDSAGFIYGTVGAAVIKMDPLTGAVVKTFGGSYKSPHGLAIDRQNNIYVNDRTSQIQKLGPDGSLLATFTTNPPLNIPGAMAFDSAGNLYVTSSAVSNPAAASLFKIDPTGQQVWATGGFVSPYGVDVDQWNNIYVTSGSSNLIVISANLTVLATIDAFQSPLSVAVDALGNAFVGEYSTNKIKEVFQPLS